MVEDREPAGRGPLAALDAPVVTNIGGFTPPFSISLFAGPVGVLLSALIALAGLAVSIYALAYISKGSTTRYHTLYLLLLVGATGVVLTGDVFNLFVFFEILCISSYALVAYVGESKGRYEIFTVEVKRGKASKPPRGRTRPPWNACSDRPPGPVVGGGYPAASSGDRP